MFFWPALNYPFNVTSIKISILIAYYRIFKTLRWFRNVVFAIGTLSIMWCIMHFFVTLFQCTPVDRVWHPSKPGHCIDTVAFYKGNAISNTIIDYMILLSPVLPVSKLQMDRTQKALILGSFALGSVSAFPSLVL